MNWPKFHQSWDVRFLCWQVADVGILLINGVKTAWHPSLRTLYCFCLFSLLLLFSVLSIYYYYFFSRMYIIAGFARIEVELDQWGLKGYSGILMFLTVFPSHHVPLVIWVASLTIQYNPKLLRTYGFCRNQGAIRSALFEWTFGHLLFLTVFPSHHVPLVI